MLVDSRALRNSSLVINGSLKFHGTCLELAGTMMLTETRRQMMTQWSTAAVGELAIQSVNFRS